MSQTISILNTLRDSDRSAYIATLFMPENNREDVAAIWAFNAEIERIRDLVSEPMPGEIRLQWWRDVLSGERQGEGEQHPVANALLGVIERYQLQTAAFDNYLEARIFDLYDDPMPDRDTLEGYLGETRSILFQMTLQILMNEDPENGDAAGHAGVALGITHILSLMALHRSRGQVFVPAEILSIGGLSGADFRTLDDPSKADIAVGALVALGREHLTKAEQAIAHLPKEYRSAFIQLGRCAPLFKRAEKRAGAVAVDPISLSPFTEQWYLTRYSLQL